MIRQKAREIALTLLPIALFSLISQLIFQVGDWDTTLRFYGGMMFVFLGLMFFIIGVENGLTKAGESFGLSLTKSNRLWFVIFIGLLLGTLITVAEPAVFLLAGQVSILTTGQISQFIFILYVSLGVGVFVSIGFLRILYDIPLWMLLLGSYLVILVLCLFVDASLIAISFDASGATTGILSVPFILSLAGGITPRKKNSKGAEKDAFGLIALACIGALIGVLILSLVSPTVISELSTTPIVEETQSVLASLFGSLGLHFLESLIAIGPIFLLFIVFQVFIIQFKKRQLRKILFGFLFAFIGLSLFMNGVTRGFMEFGRELGTTLTEHPLIFLWISSFLLGFFSIIAEPAVYVLTHKVESVTSGYINKNLVLYALSIGVGIALLINAIRISIPGNIFLWILGIGYVLSIGMMFVTPKLFVGIAFDAGGVASGPMSATFIFAFSQGIAFGIHGSVRLYDLFGMISLIAMTPIITLEGLGVLYRWKSQKG